MRKYILPESGKPERAGHAGRPGEHIRAIERIHREQSRQGISRDAAPDGRGRQQPFRGGDDLLNQKPQVIVGTAGEGRGAFEHRRAVPGCHVPVPVQAADRHQGQRRAAYCRQSVKDSLSFLAKGVQVHHRSARLSGGVHRHGFAVCHKGIHFATLPFCNVDACLYSGVLSASSFASAFANASSCSLVRLAGPFGCLPARRSFLFCHRCSKSASMLSAEYSRPF